MNNVLLQDVAEVYIRDTVTSKAYFFGITTRNEVNQTIQQTVLKGGIGNGVRGVIQSDKEIKFSVTTLFSADDLKAIQSGKDFVSGSITVQDNEVVECAGGKLTITGTPKTGTTPVVFDAHGKAISGTFADKTFTITGNAVEGALYTVVYPVDVTGDILSLDSKAFPKSYYVEMHTIGYDPDTMEVICDIYWIFNKALPNGSLQEAYEAGRQVGSDVEFTAMLRAGETEYGKYVVIPRNN